MLRACFAPENQTNGAGAIIRQFKEEAASAPQIKQIIVPPFLA